MKKITITTLALLVAAVSSYAQRSAFTVLKEKFHGEGEVFSIQTSGFLARVILSFAGEHEFKKTIQHIQQVRFITIPKSSFEKNDVTVHGFKKVLAKDSFEPLATIRDRGDDVSFYIKSGKRDLSNRYFILIDSDDEVVAMEIKGYIDPEHLLKNSTVSYNH